MASIRFLCTLPLVFLDSAVWQDTSSGDCRRVFFRAYWCAPQLGQALEPMSIRVLQYLQRTLTTSLVTTWAGCGP